MNILLLLAFSFIPIAIIIFYFKKEKIEKDKKKILIKIFVFEMVLAVFDIWLENTIHNRFILNNNIYTMLLYYIFAIALVEEISKFIPAYIFGIRNKKYQSFYDTIIFCFFSVLGFSQIENFLFLLEANNTISTGILRVLLCIPGHAIYSLLMGILFGIAIRYKRDKKNIKFYMYILLSIIIPATMHGLYDYTISSGNNLAQFVSIGVESLLFIYLLSKTLELRNNRDINNENKEFEKLGKRILEIAIILITVILIILNFSKQNFQYTDGKVGIGEKIVINDVTVIVNSVEEYDYQNSIEKDNGKYVKINVTINNNSEKEFYTDMMLSGEFILINNLGDEFNSNNYINSLKSIVYSGESVNGDLYFKTQLSNKMRLVYNDYGSSFEKTKYIININ